LGIRSRPTRSQRAAIAAAQEKFDTYKSQAFAIDGSTLHPKSKDAAYSMQCPSPIGFEDNGVTQFKCASGTCEDCGVYCRPCVEEKIQKPIKYYSFKRLPTCSNCGSLDAGSKICPTCVQLHSDESKRGKIKNRQHLVWNHTTMEEFNKLYTETLKQYNLHRFKFLILSKKFVIDVRQKTLRPGEVCLQHDFSEALKLVHNEEVSVLLNFIVIYTLSSFLVLTSLFPFICFFFLHSRYKASTS